MNINNKKDCESVIHGSVERDYVIKKFGRGNLSSISHLSKCLPPRLFISSVGHSRTKNHEAIRLTNAPIKIDTKSEKSSLRSEKRVNSQSDTLLPKVIPMTGPLGRSEQSKAIISYF